MEYTTNTFTLPETDQEVTYITRFDEEGATTFLADPSNIEYQKYLEDTKPQ